jgi:hypothetical protein
LQVGGFTEPLEGSPQALAGASLRLILRLGGTPRDQLLSKLLELAGDSVAEGRREAAESLPAARLRLGELPIFTLALALTQDPDVSVRAPAGMGLARLGRAASPEIAAVTNERLLGLLGEPGTDVPLYTLAGLRDTEEAANIDASVMSEVRRVQQSHPSRSVQDLARQVLDGAQ